MQRFRSTPVFLAAPILFAALIAGTIAAACSGSDGDDPGASSPTTAPAADSAADHDPGDSVTGAADDASAMWVFDQVDITHNEYWDGASPLRGWRLFPGSPTIAVADNHDGHVALVSDDLIGFRPVHRGCCGTTLADRLGDRVLVAAVDETSVSAAHSPDGGTSWATQPFVLPGGSEGDEILPADIAVVDGGYVAVARPTPLSRSLPGAVYRSTDLAVWEPVALPGLPAALPDGSHLALARGVADDGSRTVWVVAHQADSSGPRTVVPFRISGVGTVIEPMPVLDMEAAAVAGVADRLVAWPSPNGRTPDRHAAPWVLVPGAGWVQAPADNGQWGDGDIFVYAAAVDPATGRLTAFVQRTLRSTADACFVDPQDCDRSETAIVTSPDGLRWRDVDAPAWEAPDSERAVDKTPAIAATGHGGWLVWQPGPGPGPDDATAHRWTGPAPIPTSDPVEYATDPDSPHRLYTDGPIAVGETVRYVLGAGSVGPCPDTFLIDGYWDVAPDPPPTAPAGWPARPGSALDGPSVQFYGELERVAVDRMVFSMDGADIEFTLTPATVDATVCHP